MTQPTPLPFGLRDIRVTGYTDATATTLQASGVDFPNARTLTFAETEEFEELRGDDQVVASHGSGPGVEWELEGGGLPFEAIAVMYGNTVQETGVAPNRVKTMDKTVDQVRPYFQIEGQSISDNGGDVHGIIYRAKATGNLAGEFADGAFFLTGASGIGLPSLMAASLKRVYRFVQNETVTAIP